MDKRIVCIYRNDTVASKDTEVLLKQKLESCGITACNDLTEDAELLACIGGDGATLDAIHKYNFPSVPIVGINTGHLGFFQEIHPDELEDFIFNYNKNKYSIQRLITVQAEIQLNNGETLVHGSSSRNLKQASYVAPPHISSE